MTLNWFVKDLLSGNTLQNGTTIVKQNGVVVLPQIEIFKESIRKVQIVVLDPTVGNNGKILQTLLPQISRFNQIQFTDLGMPRNLYDSDFIQ
ncbi:MAG: hypothetical protein IPL42_14720 [Saprospiraceae bacterium]|nr:hypothetical protein [Saprospiraceae bacterium]